MGSLDAQPGNMLGHARAADPRFSLNPPLMDAAGQVLIGGEGMPQPSIKEHGGHPPDWATHPSLTPSPSMEAIQPIADMHPEDEVELDSLIQVYPCSSKSPSLWSLILPDLSAGLTSFPSCPQTLHPCREFTCKYASALICHALKAFDPAIRV